MLSSGEARAAPGDAATAEALFRDARARMTAGNYESACAILEESLRLDFALGTLLNLATCEEHRGELARAWEHYAELVERLPPDDDRRELVVERATYLERAVPRLTVLLASSAPSTTRVARDSVVLEAPSLGVPLPVDSGNHTIEVLAEGHAARFWTVSLRPGERRALVVEPGAAVVARRTAAWIAGGLGIASLGVGTFFGVRALTERSDSDALCAGNVCRDPQGPRSYDDAKSSALIADISLGVGLVGVVLASYLFLSSPAVERAPTAAAFAVHVSPGGLQGTW